MGEDPSESMRVHLGTYPSFAGSLFDGEKNNAGLKHAHFGAVGIKCSVEGALDLMLIAIVVSIQNFYGVEKGLDEEQVQVRTALSDLDENFKGANIVEDELDSLFNLFDIHLHFNFSGVFDVFTNRVCVLIDIRHNSRFLSLGVLVPIVTL